MNKLVREWINKAEADYHSALREYRARTFPNYDSACFHAQQSIEKYLKAILQWYDIRFHKVHDLLALLKLIAPQAPHLEFHKESFAFLNPFAVTFRYPGETATREQAKQAIDTLISLRSLLRDVLNLESNN